MQEQLYQVLGMICICLQENIRKCLIVNVYLFSSWSSGVNSVIGIYFDQVISRWCSYSSIFSGVIVSLLIIALTLFPIGRTFTIMKDVYNHIVSHIIIPAKSCFSNHHAINNCRSSAL